MKSSANKFQNIDEYISTFPDEVQTILQQIRETISKAAPRADEVISYQMPAFKLHRVLVYFAGYKNHIGFYPGAKAIETFHKELSKFKTSKGAIHFPLNKAIPLTLISKITKFRVKEELETQKRN